MIYVQTKFCKGTFILEKHINLNNFLNQNEKKKFFELKERREEEALSEEEFEWYEDVLNRIKEESNSIEAEVVSYEVDDWEEYDDENKLIF